MSRFNRSFLIFIAVICVSLASCSSQKDHSEDILEIYQVLELRQQAITNKDLELYDRILFSEYSSAGVNRNLVLDDLKLSFTRFPNMSVKIPRIRPVVKLNSARIMQSSFYRTGTTSPVVEIKETLMFRRIADKWYISAGIELGLSSRLKKGLQ